VNETLTSDSESSSSGSPSLQGKKRKNNVKMKKRSKGDAIVSFKNSSSFNSSGQK
jgi:hypothetical protein